MRRSGRGVVARSINAARVSRALLATLVVAGCQPADSGSDLAVDTAYVVLGGAGSEEHVVPARVVVRTGGAVVFETVDHRVHTITFEADSIDAAGLTFLSDSGQLRSPPLVTRGTVYRISLEGAPPGYYPFWAEGPGPPVRGAIFVE